MIAKRLWADFHRLFLNKPVQPPANPMVIAAIPVIAKEKAGNWSTVSTNLARTVASVLTQDYDQVEVLICGQDAPEGLPASEQVRFLKAPPIKTRKKTDKGQKIALMTDDLAKRYHNHCVYIMFLDADDLLHPKLFSHVAKDNNGRGYLINKGYLTDLESNDFAPLSPESGHSLDKHCGSCAVFAADFSQPWVTKRYLKTLSRGHNRYGELSRRFGIPLDAVPFSAALYVINHGENARARRSDGGFKAELLKKTRITDKSACDRIARSFGLERDP